MGEFTGSLIPLLHDHTLSLLTIPVLSGLTGYVINWTGVWMLYKPVRFKGFHVPGLLALARRFPRKLRGVPGLREGGIGWQGIIPSRARKLGTIAVENQIAKIGEPREFYEQLDPDELADHIVASSREDVRDLVGRIMARDHPELWRELPPRARELVYSRVDEEMPGVAREVTAGIGENIDELFDVKQMVIRLTYDNPELTNKLFHEVAAKEFRIIIRLGFVFGFLFALPAIPLVIAVPEWWVLPLAEAVIGYATNWAGIWMIYEPREPRKFGPFRLQGLFLRRQHDAAAAYGEVISEDVITLSNMGEELLHGPRSDRTRALIESALRPAVDRAAGAARPAVRVGMGAEEYEATRDAVAAGAVEKTLAPLQDEELGHERGAQIRELFTERMREMSKADFSETMRAATREDEWMLVAHGALFGVVGGLLHYVIFGV